MIMTESLFTITIIIGLVGGVVCLTTLVLLLVIEKEYEYLIADKRKTELEKLLKEAQLENVASQIQPHFLFNALNIITSLIRLEKNKKAENAIYSISLLLRYSTRESEELVTIKEEVFYIKMFLNIQNLRFGNRLTWSIDESDEISYFKIPKFLIQPFVENACKHGIEPKINGGLIHIVTERNHNQLVIKVVDNGLGIPEKIVNEFNAWKNENISTETFGIGIKNTYKRIKHFYGSNGNLEISSLSPGTSCIIRINNYHDLLSESKS